MSCLKCPFRIQSQTRMSDHCGVSVTRKFQSPTLLIASITAMVIGVAAYVVSQPRRGRLNITKRDIS
jgi:hypothetical protein